MSGLDGSLAVVVRSMGWLSVGSVGVFDVLVMPSGVPGLKFVLVVSWSKMEMYVLVSVAVSGEMLISWHWVACRQAQSSCMV